MRTYSRKKPECQVIDGVKDMCRLCLRKSEEVVPIFSQNADDVCSSLSTRIMICVGLEMIQEDCLPDIICTNCNTELEKCYKFRKMCEKTYQKLKIHLQSCKINEYKKNIITENKTDSSETIVLSENGNTESIETNELNSVNDVEYIYADKSNLVLVFNENDVEIGNSETDIIETNISQSIIEVNANTSHEILSTEVVDCEPVTCQKNYAEVTQTIAHIESKSNSHVTLEVAPKIAKYIKNELVETGILMLQEGRVALPHDMNTILELVTEDGYMVTMHLDETNDQEDLESEGSLCAEYEPKNEIQEPYSILDLNKRMQVRNSARSKNNALNECATCGKRFARRSALHRHARAHSSLRAFACARCGRRFAQKEVMKRHELVHQEKRPFACAQCPKSFTQRGGLAAHARSHAAPHARALTLHSCTLCPKIFLYASGLSRHMKTHSGRIYTCGECHRPFKDKSSLRRHLKANNHRPANPLENAARTVQET